MCLFLPPSLGSESIIANVAGGVRRISVCVFVFLYVWGRRKAIMGQTEERRQIYDKNEIDAERERERERERKR